MYHYSQTELFTSFPNRKHVVLPCCNHGGGGLSSSLVKVPWGCAAIGAARKGILFWTSCLAKGVSFGNFSLVKGMLFGNFGQRKVKLR